MIIDAHAHFYPPRFIEQFDSWKKYGFEVQRDASGNRVLSRQGKLIAVYTDAFYSLDKRLEEMDKGRVDVQALSFVQPGIYWAEPELGLSLCQLINDEMHQIVKKYPSRFIGIAAVPLQDVDRAIQELERAVRHLECKGVGIGTTINEMDLDSQELFPFYQKAEELSIPILVHPFAWERDRARLSPYYLETAVLGFMFENTIAILKVILGGILEKYPNLRFSFAHLGGAVPYLIGRIEKAAALRPQMCAKISYLPSFYLRKMYIDTAYFYSPAILCALACIPEEQIIFGTDYPFPIGDSPERAVSQMQQDTSLSESLKQKIMTNNPASFLDIR